MRGGIAANGGLAAKGDRVSRILVRGPNWAGDLAMSTPGFRALRAGFPSAHITLHLRPGLEGLIAGAPWFDEILGVSSYHAGGRALLLEGWSLRGRHFDLGLCLPDSFSSALLMRVAGVTKIVGYRRAGRAPLLHQAVKAPPDWGKRRMVARERFVLDLVASLGCAEFGTELELFTTAREEAALERALSLHGVAPGERLVLIAPGASYGTSKLWPFESFAAVGDAMAQAGVRVILSGSAQEGEIASRVRGAMREPAIDLTGELDLGRLKALVRRASLVVCNDAGARHIAVAFRVPCLVLMGPTSLEKTNLNLAGVRVFEAQAHCRPCYLRDCPTDHRCMTRIQPSRVIDVALSVLGGTSGAESRL